LFDSLETGILEPAASNRHAMFITTPLLRLDALTMDGLVTIVGANWLGGVIDNLVNPKLERFLEPKGVRKVEVAPPPPQQLKHI